MSAIIIYLVCRDRKKKKTLIKTMENKLYVGNLPYKITEDELNELFSQAGSVSSVNIIKDRDSRESKGFGFVEMSSAEEAKKAIEMLDNSEVGDDTNKRNLKVSPARPMETR